jgi:hypothetical protein
MSSVVGSAGFVNKNARKGISPPTTIAMIIAIRSADLLTIAIERSTTDVERQEL